MGTPTCCKWPGRSRCAMSTMASRARRVNPSGSTWDVLEDKGMCETKSTVAVATRACVHARSLHLVLQTQRADAPTTA